MKIVVTGASGHVGANLTRELIKRGYEVKVLEHIDNRGFVGLPVEVVKGNLNDIDSLKRLCSDADIVFHLAAKISIGLNSYETLHKVNFDGTRNILSIARENGVKRFIYFSSIHVLEHKPYESPMTESRGLLKNAEIPYERTKAEADEWVLQQTRDDFEVVVLNPTAIVGPYDFKPSLMGQMIIKLSTGKLPFLVPGGYNWVDVRDVAAAAANAISQGRSGERYILSGRWESLKGIGELISKVLNKPLKFFVIPISIARLGLPFISLAAKISGKQPLYTSKSLEIVNNVNKNIVSDKAKKELGFSPRQLEETIRDTVEWFKENKYI
jgi:dihydroflavonol-4-reductase